MGAFAIIVTLLAAYFGWKYLSTSWKLTDEKDLRRSLERKVERLEEEADGDNGTYNGNWSAITTVNATDLTSATQKAVRLTSGAYSLVRARISTVIAGAGGSVSAVFVGAP